MKVQSADLEIFAVECSTLYRFDKALQHEIAFLYLGNGTTEEDDT